MVLALLKEPVRGLDDEAVAERVARGQVNHVEAGPSRTVGEIVRANVFTRFNAILGVLLVVIAVVGPPQDALFGAVLVANTGIGIIQEWRAKRVLDRLALLAAPQGHVVRNGEPRDVAVDEVVLVLDDVVEVRPGEQVPVDGVVIKGVFEVDESLLSGESEPRSREVGAQVLSGSLVGAGGGWLRATGVGRDAYVQQLSVEAKRFQLARSELRAGIDEILRLVTWVMAPVAVLLVTSQLGHEDFRDAVRSSVAGVGSMVPEGLVLLASMAFAVAVMRLGRKQALVQELGAVEGLARVDVLCLDKTGTITAGEIELREVVTLDPSVGEDELRTALAAVARADANPNATMRALRGADAPPAWPESGTIPFSSARKWSAARFAEHGTWVLGAPDVLLERLRDVPPTLAGDVAQRAEQGMRVLLVARADDDPPLDADLPAAAPPVALLVLAEELRPDAAQTLAYFTAEGVAIKLVSGDHPRTVAAVAARVGIGDGTAVDARTLPSDPVARAELVEHTSVFGRVTPHQKRDIVGALQSRGHVVGMTGDGVNDVLALKNADLGVAMGSGTAAARSVAKVVLLDDRFETLPEVVAEGRRVIANVERVANLFVTKTVYAVLLAVAVGVADVPFPFLPRHLTIVSSLTIGVPGFFLALAPNAARARGGFVGHVLRFAGPAGAVAGTATLAAYAVARGQPDVSLAGARTTATFVLFGVALWVLSILARPLTEARVALVGGMALTFGVVMALPTARHFYGLEPPPGIVVLAAVGVVALAVGALEGGWRVAGWYGRRRHRTMVADRDVSTS